MTVMMTGQLTIYGGIALIVDRILRYEETKTDKSKQATDYMERQYTIDGLPYYDDG